MDSQEVQASCGDQHLSRAYFTQFNMYRSATCPKELATTYPAPDDHIRTLYDILEHTVQRHPEVYS